MRFDDVLALGGEFICVVRLKQSAAGFFGIVLFVHDHRQACNLFADRVLPRFAFQVGSMLPRVADYLRMSVF